MGGSDYVSKSFLLSIRIILFFEVIRLFIFSRLVCIYYLVRSIFSMAPRVTLLYLFFLLYIVLGYYNYNIARGVFGTSQFHMSPYSLFCAVLLVFCCDFVSIQLLIFSGRTPILPTIVSILRLHLAVLSAFIIYPLSLAIDDTSICVYYYRRAFDIYFFISRRPQAYAFPTLRYDVYPCEAL